jgi:methylated-DNA-protein-cysteine methyltransferase-like protein
MSPDANFREKVEAFMAEVPYGHVVTYGDLAGLAGQANASRVVGGIAHFGNPDLPWHRLVNRFGGLAAGFHGGREAQAQLLLHEGITCTNHIVDNFETLRWRPNQN